MDCSNPVPLLALGLVVKALADRTMPTFRASKLTLMLQSSLVGDGRTLVIGCIAPGEKFMADTTATLKFADRAMNVKAKTKTAAKAPENDADLIQRLKDEVKTLKSQLKQAKSELSIQELGSSPGDWSQETREE